MVYFFANDDPVLVNVLDSIKHVLQKLDSGTKR